MMPEFHTLVVKEVRKETADTVSISFDLKNGMVDAYSFKPGQYLTLRKEIENDDVRRSYSICSGVNEGDIRVAVKRIEGGLFSTFANDILSAGDTLQVMTPMGNFTVDLNADNQKHYVLFAVGSGITPMMSILKSILAKEPKSEVSLVYGNRIFNSIIFRDELEDLKDANLGRLRLFHVLSQEMNEIDLYAGRIDEKKVDRFFNTFLDIKRCDEVFICGPEPMIDTVSKQLKTLGMPEGNIHFELFSSPKGSLYKEKEIVVTEEHLGKNCHVDIQLYGQRWEFDMPFDRSVLDFATEKGLDLPFSCKGGMCCTCRAKLKEGEVEMKVNYALEPGEVDEGYILTCQAVPKSEKLVINYDE